MGTIITVGNVGLYLFKSADKKFTCFRECLWKTCLRSRGPCGAPSPLTSSKLDLGQNHSRPTGSSAMRSRTSCSDFKRFGRQLSITRQTTFPELRWLETRVGDDVLIDVICINDLFCHGRSTLCFSERAGIYTYTSPASQTCLIATSEASSFCALDQSTS
jgi:hypothetical protein